MRRKQRGFSLIELLVVVAVILIISAIAVPRFLHARMAANEASAAASIRSINTSEAAYQSTFGPGYASKLVDLSDGGAPSNCVFPTAPTATSSCLIDSALASGTKSGYVFTYTPTSTGAIVSQYAVNADPLGSGSSGQRHFYGDQSLVISYNAAAPASPSDPPI